MDVFNLDRALLGDYERFARSFTEIRAGDIRSQVDEIYASRRFWPEPLVTINPHFELDASVDALADDGSLHPDTARIVHIAALPRIEGLGDRHRAYLRWHREKLFVKTMRVP